MIVAFTSGFNAPDLSKAFEETGSTPLSDTTENMHDQNAENSAANDESYATHDLLTKKSDMEHVFDLIANGNSGQALNWLINKIHDLGESDTEAATELLQTFSKEFEHRNFDQLSNILKHSFDIQGTPQLQLAPTA